MVQVSQTPLIIEDANNILLIALKKQVHSKINVNRLIPDTQSLLSEQQDPVTLMVRNTDFPAR